jgi:hypothetical protein
MAASRRRGSSSRRLDSRGLGCDVDLAGGVRLLDLGDANTSGSPCLLAVGSRRRLCPSVGRLVDRLEPS